jgi:hypothetical protein
MTNTAIDLSDQPGEGLGADELLAIWRGMTPQQQQAATAGARKEASLRGVDWADAAALAAMAALLTSGAGFQAILNPLGERPMEIDREAAAALVRSAFLRGIHIDGA